MTQVHLVRFSESDVGFTMDSGGPIEALTPVIQGKKCGSTHRLMGAENNHGSFLARSASELVLKKKPLQQQDHYSDSIVLTAAWKIHLCIEASQPARQTDSSRLVCHTQLCGAMMNSL